MEKENKSAEQLAQENVAQVAENEKQQKKGGWKKWAIIAGTVVLAAGAGLYLYKKGSGSEVQEVEPTSNDNECCGDCNRNNNKHYYQSQKH